jgi:hypothetical protein
MTAKEKALSLFDWYYSAICDLIPVADGYERASRYNDVEPKAKRCALIAVDEIILSIIQIHNGMTWSERKQTTERNTGYAYWTDVKREIEKL